MDTQINLDNFDKSFQLGLLFSLYEGLDPDKCLYVTYSGDLQEIYKSIQDAEINNLKFELINEVNSHVKFKLSKLSTQKVGCCGMCGG